MGGGFPVRDRARDNNHRREITMLIFVAPQGVVWRAQPSLERPHINRESRRRLTVINDHESGPSTVTPRTPSPYRSQEIRITGRRGRSEKKECDLHLLQRDLKTQHFRMCNKHFHITMWINTQHCPPEKKKKVFFQVSIFFSNNSSRKTNHFLKQMDATTELGQIPSSKV